jgi:hypothetical protein
VESLAIHGRAVAVLQPLQNIRSMIVATVPDGTVDEKDALRGKFVPVSTGVHRRL